MFHFKFIVSILNASQHEISIKVVVPNSYWALEIPIFSPEHYSHQCTQRQKKKTIAFFGKIMHVRQQGAQLAGGISILTTQSDTY